MTKKPRSHAKGRKTVHTHTHNSVRKIRRQMPEILQVHPKGHTNH